MRLDRTRQSLAVCPGESLRGTQGVRTYSLMAGLPHKDRHITIKLTAEHVRILDQRAKRCGVSRAVWMRSILLQAASKEPNEGYVRLKEPNGSLS